MGIFGQLRQMQQAKEASSSESAEIASRSEFAKKSEAVDFDKILDRVSHDPNFKSLVVLAVHILRADESGPGDSGLLRKYYKQINGILSSEGFAELRDEHLQALVEASISEMQSNQATTTRFGRAA